MLHTFTTGSLSFSGSSIVPAYKYQPGKFYSGRDKAPEKKKRVHEEFEATTTTCTRLLISGCDHKGKIPFNDAAVLRGEPNHQGFFVVGNRIYCQEVTCDLLAHANLGLSGGTGKIVCQSCQSRCLMLKCLGSVIEAEQTNFKLLISCVWLLFVHIFSNLCYLYL